MKTDSTFTGTEIEQRRHEDAKNPDESKPNTTTRHKDTGEGKNDAADDWHQKFRLIQLNPTKKISHGQTWIGKMCCVRYPVRHDFGSLSDGLRVNSDLSIARPSHRFRGWLRFGRRHLFHSNRWNRGGNWPSLVRWIMQGWPPMRSCWDCFDESRAMSCWRAFCDRSPWARR